MRYLLLVYEDDRQSGRLTAGEREALALACEDHDAALRRSGYLLAAEPVQGSDNAAVVRLRAGALAVNQGAVAQARAQLRTVLTIQARDLNEAIQVAAAMPQARLGPIEVRPLRA